MTTEFIRVLKLCKQFIKYHKYEATAKVNIVMSYDRDRLTQEHAQLCEVRLYL